MNKKIAFALWGVLFALTAGLGFLPESEGVLQGLRVALSLIFFLPPARVLYLARKQGDRDAVRLVRNLSALSLAVTLVTLILNFVLAVSSEKLGNILHCVLTVVSAPMICSGYWVLSLFLWACLLMASLKLLRK